MSTAIEVQQSVYETEVREILGKLDQNQRDIIADWLAKQHRLETEGDKGFSNVSVIVAWLLNRRYAICEANLTTALTNSMNNGKRKIHFKELPKQDRSTATGRINHALVNPAQEGFMPKAETNRTFHQLVESNQPKPEVPVEAVHEDFQVKAETVTGRTHSQTDLARRIVVTVLNSRVIDWEQTYQARLRFVNRQAALVRR
jgi:hypothetical protein